MECPYCEATMVDMTDEEEVDRTECLVFMCLGCGFTQKATSEGVETVLESSSNLLRKKAERLLKKAEEAEVRLDEMSDS